MSDELTEYQHKVGLLNVKHAARGYVDSADRDGGEKLLRELVQTCQYLSSYLGLGFVSNRERERRAKGASRRPGK